MPRWIIPLLIASAIIFILEYYAFQAVKTVTRNRIIRWVWMAFGILVYLNLLFVILLAIPIVILFVLQRMGKI